MAGLHWDGRQYDDQSVVRLRIARDGGRIVLAGDIVRDGGRIVLAGDVARDGGRIILAGDIDCEGWWSYRTGW